MTTTQNTGGKRLATCHSEYLRSAANQPVEWYPWGGEAFEIARANNRPVLLDIGAAWCHWCHVMDHESYENVDTAAIINRLFVAVKVDRDERPDIDARYQQAVQVVSGQGGWPLTAFLTPEGDAFWGGTYFPPDDRFGRPGFPRVLEEVAAFYAEREGDAASQAAQIRKALAAPVAQPGELTPVLVDTNVEQIHSQYDATYGGFGGAPKFPHSSAIDLLMSRHHAGDVESLEIVARTLRAMAGGGIHDQLGGGFHRYSVDERWVVPHFEKMLYDNAGLLSNYARAYALTGDLVFRDVARDIMRFADSVLSDRRLGGFYASQDADIDGDDGDYWTWTVAEVKAALSDEEFRVAQVCFDIYDQGEMHLDPSRNVLFIAGYPGAVAEQVGMPVEDVEALIVDARDKLLRTRSERPTPFVDRTIYASWNGMMVVAYLDAARFLDDDRAREFGLTTLDRLLSEGLRDDGLMAHRIGGDRATATLDDQVHVALACLSAFAETGDMAYLDRARKLSDAILERFRDPKDGLFFDVPPTKEAQGLLSVPVKSAQDSPVPSANGSVVQLLERVGRLTGEARYSEAAENAARSLVGIVGEYGLFGASAFLGMAQVMEHPPLSVVVGDSGNPDTQVLRHALRATTRWAAEMLVVAPSGTVDDVPDIARAQVESYIASGEIRPVAFICAGGACSRPVYDACEAAEIVATIGVQ